ncbi:MAG: hypothetical protein Harvfovirus27_4 [Harvfovirus sp.]|uniref:Uncharacterized protein n=1 Tax=Harvfovirus sp. TaxID=2487768 RepID=A0A3G5A290_9VIRU|nr:MAG: hypothetical protein Harvfovirus27_4 [Harvfovirus sp.]
MYNLNDLAAMGLSPMSSPRTQTTPEEKRIYKMIFYGVSPDNTYELKYLSYKVDFTYKTCNKLPQKFILYTDVKFSNDIHFSGKKALLNFLTYAIMILDPRTNDFLIFDKRYNPISMIIHKDKKIQSKKINFSQMKNPDFKQFKIMVPAG